MLRPGTFALTALLAALSAIGPLTTDMYLPSLPDIAQQLDASTAQVQFTISSYLLGFAVGQILYGPISDRHGRKPVLVGGYRSLLRGKPCLRVFQLDRNAHCRPSVSGTRRLRRHRAHPRRLYATSIRAREPDANCR